MNALETGFFPWSPEWGQMGWGPMSWGFSKELWDRLNGDNALGMGRSEDLPTYSALCSCNCSWILQIEGWWLSRPLQNWREGWEWAKLKHHNPDVLTKAQSFFLNKHFSDCYKPSINFQSSEKMMLLMILPVFPLLSWRSGCTDVLLLPFWKPHLWKVIWF